MRRQLKLLLSKTIISPLVLTMLKIHTRITHQERARVMIINEVNEILLVRGVIGPRWSLPGGGIEKGETALRAAVREVYEETGIRLSEDALQLLGVIAPGVSDVNYMAHLYVGYVQKDALPTRQFNTTEIIDIAWTSMVQLPDDVSPLTHVGVELLSKH